MAAYFIVDIEIRDPAGSLHDDAATRVVVPTGAPPVFSAGADAKTLSSAYAST